jgi:hypothetical protein
MVRKFFYLDVFYRGSYVPTISAAACQLIRDIRAAHGFNNDQSTKDPTVLKLRGKLERALDR